MSKRELSRWFDFILTSSGNTHTQKNISSPIIKPTNIVSTLKQTNLSKGQLYFFLLNFINNQQKIKQWLWLTENKRKKTIIYEIANPVHVSGLANQFVYKKRVKKCSSSRGDDSKMSTQSAYTSTSLFQCFLLSVR